jgi:hypothetical protein
MAAEIATTANLGSHPRPYAEAGGALDGWSSEFRVSELSAESVRTILGGFRSMLKVVRGK